MEAFPQMSTSLLNYLIHIPYMRTNTCYPASLRRNIAGILIGIAAFNALRRDPRHFDPTAMYDTFIVLKDSIFEKSTLRVPPIWTPNRSCEGTR